MLITCMLTYFDSFAEYTEYIWLYLILYRHKGVWNLFPGHIFCEMF